MKRLSFTCSEDMAAFLEAYAESEGFSLVPWIRKTLATACDWTLTEEDEPPLHRRRLSPVPHTQRKANSNGKRADAIAAAIDEARARRIRNTVR